MGRWRKTGGVVGSFPNSQQNDGEDEVDPLIQGNFVALTSITAPEVTEGDFPGQNNTVHRIVGYTRANEAEEQDYDEDYNPIYGPNFEADKALKDNYAISTLAIVEPAIADDAASTEGKSIEAGNLSRDFFADTLGSVSATKLPSRGPVRRLPRASTLKTDCSLSHPPRLPSRFPRRLSSWFRFTAKNSPKR